MAILKRESLRAEDGQTWIFDIRKIRDYDEPPYEYIFRHANGRLEIRVFANNKKEAIKMARRKFKTKDYGIPYK